MVAFHAKSMSTFPISNTIFLTISIIRFSLFPPEHLLYYNLESGLCHEKLFY